MRCHAPIHSTLLVMQLLLLLLVTSAAAAMPPRQGDIVIVSLAGEEPAAIAKWALKQDARLVGPGPSPHSLVVNGKRARLFATAISRRAVILAGGFAGCGRSVL